MCVEVEVTLDVSLKNENQPYRWCRNAGIGPVLQHSSGLKAYVTAQKTFTSALDQAMIKFTNKTIQIPGHITKHEMYTIAYCITVIRRIQITIQCFALRCTVIIRIRRIWITVKCFALHFQHRLKIWVMKLNEFFFFWVMDMCEQVRQIVHWNMWGDQVCVENGYLISVWNIVGGLYTISAFSCCLETAEDHKEDQWMGVRVRSQGPGGDVVVRWTFLRTQH